MIASDTSFHVGSRYNKILHEQFAKGIGRVGHVTLVGVSPSEILPDIILLPKGIRPGDQQAVGKALSYDALELSCAGCIGSTAQGIAT